MLRHLVSVLSVLLKHFTNVEDVCIFQITIVGLALHERHLILIAAFVEVLAVNHKEFTWLTVVVHVGQPVLGEERKVLVDIVCVFQEHKVIVCQHLRYAHTHFRYQYINDLVYNLFWHNSENNNFIVFA
jgi:hypothetical protein